VFFYDSLKAHIGVSNSVSDDGDPRAAVARVDSRHKQPELLNQSLVCQGLFPPISCGGGVTLTKSARSETPTAINLR